MVRREGNGNYTIRLREGIYFRLVTSWCPKAIKEISKEYIWPALAPCRGEGSITYICQECPKIMFLSKYKITLIRQQIVTFPWTHDSCRLPIKRECEEAWDWLHSSWAQNGRLFGVNISHNANIWEDCIYVKFFYFYFTANHTEYLSLLKQNI
jgi:hypothetical protein